MKVYSNATYQLVTDIFSSLVMWLVLGISNIVFLHYSFWEYCLFAISLEIVFRYWRILLHAMKWIMMLIIPAILFSFLSPTLGAIMAIGWFAMGALLVFRRSNKKEEPPEVIYQI